MAGLSFAQVEGLRGNPEAELLRMGGMRRTEVAQLLGVALGTVKTRIRDGLIRMRDCLEVKW